jgi:hypothetical protein
VDELAAPPLWLGPSFDSVELARGVTELSDGRKVAGKVVRIRYGRVVVSTASTRGSAYDTGSVATTPGRENFKATVSTFPSARPRAS